MASYTLISGQTFAAGTTTGQYCSTVSLSRIDSAAVSVQVTSGSTAQTGNTSGEIIMYIAGTPFAPTTGNAPSQLQYQQALPIVVPPTANTTTYVNSAALMLYGPNLYIWFDGINIPSNSQPTITVIATEISDHATLLFSESPGTWQYTNNNTAITDASSHQIMTAAGVGLRNYTTGIQVSNTSATVSTVFNILDGATVINSIHLPANTSTNPEVPYLYNFETPLKGTANTTLNVQCVTTGASVYVNMQGFIAP